MTVQQPCKMGLVLTAGGARAAYQVGVLRGISEIIQAEKNVNVDFPFQVISGTSAGALNGAYLACARDSFDLTTSRLYQLWLNLKEDKVYRTDLAYFSKQSASWVRNLGFGGSANATNFLLETSPLREFLNQNLDFSQLELNLQSGKLFGVSVSATNYGTGTAVSFFEGNQSIEPWARSTRIGLREKITVEHVMASAAIPILFPPIKLRRCFYGDGGIRLQAPMSPTVHMGASKIIAIGIRYLRPESDTIEINQAFEQGHVNVADMAGVLLNAAFLDSFDTDLERIERINATLSLMTEEQRQSHPAKLKIIPILAFRPSQDLGKMAVEQLQQFPRVLRHFLRGIGANEERGWDFLSYLAFNTSYTRKLLELGYQDSMNRSEEVLKFFECDTR